MLTISDGLRQRLREHDQEQVLRFWDELSEGQREILVAQLERLDLGQLRQLYQSREQLYAVPSEEHIKPITVLPRHGPEDDVSREVGAEALKRGEVAVMLVAGGQGARLGFDAPKGMFPIGPVSQKSLYQIHAEKVLALRRRHGGPVPLLVMTSHATHDDTEAFFAEQDYFGLPETDVYFFCQGTMPALDLATGRLLLEEKHRLFLSPDGHGGMLTAFAESGLLDRMLQRGFRHVFYFQVDNPLVRVADATFVGQHIRHGSEASSKVVAKRGPDEPMGVFARVEGRCRIIEYSDLPRRLAEERDAGGRLLLWAGSPAVHLFDLGFLARLARRSEPLPFHAAKKKVPHLDERGGLVTPETPNALKLERFIFDVLPLAERWLVAETGRDEEFAPVKNASGADSPESCRLALSQLAARWLEQAGVDVPRHPDGTPHHPLEISPLYALDAEELARKVGPDLHVEGPLHLS